jgi:hypothetical protein
MPIDGASLFFRMGDIAIVGRTTFTQGAISNRVGIAQIIL